MKTSFEKFQNGYDEINWANSGEKYLAGEVQIGRLFQVKDKIGDLYSNLTFVCNGAASDNQIKAKRFLDQSGEDCLFDSKIEVVPFGFLY